MTDPTDRSTGATPARANSAPASSPRRDRMLSELAAELRAAREEHRHDVAQLRTDLAGLSTLVADNADLLGQLTPRVGDLDVELADLDERLDTLANAVATGAGAAGQDVALVDWPSLSADDATAEWQALGDWVAAVLGPFYEITRAQLPDCWALHRPALLELVWLHRTYMAAHRPDAAPAAAADWHTRWRREALANIAAAIPERWCRPGEHWVDSFGRVEQHPSRQAAYQRTRDHVPGQRPDHLGAGEQISTPQHWGPGLQSAAGADIAWRRERDATTDPPPSG